MALNRQAVVRNARVVAVYLFVLSLVIVWWLMFERDQAAHTASDMDRVLIGLWQATGPYAFWIHPTDNFASEVVLPFGIIWLGWLGIVLATPMRNWPLSVHAVMCALWCFAGLLPTSLLIT